MVHGREGLGNGSGGESGERSKSVTSERTLPGENDSPPGSVRAEESSQRKHSETRMSLIQEERGKHWRRVQLGSQHVDSEPEEIWREHADSELSG